MNKLNKYYFIIGVEIIIFIALSLLYLFVGYITHTEGGYVYVSQLVYQGKMPYVDFAYNQTPLYPYILGLPLYLFGYNVYTGRICSLVFSLLTFFLCLRLAKKLGGNTAILVTAGLMAFNSFQIYNFIIIKMHALTGLFLLLAVYVLFLPLKKLQRYCLVTAILTIGIGFRLTLLPALLIILAGIIIMERNKKENFIYPVLIFIGMSLLIFTPFAIGGWEQFYYNIIGLNLDISIGMKAKLYTFNELVRTYFFSLLMIIFIISHRIVKLSSWHSLKEQMSHYFSRDEGNNTKYLPLLWAVIAVMTASHVMAKLPQAAYQSSIFPLLSLLIGISFSEIFEDLKQYPFLKRGLNLAFISGCILTLLSQGLTFLAPANNRHSPVFIKDEADFIKAHTRPEDKIMSADTPLIAVEAQRKLLRGFSWNEYYPEWSVEKAKKMSVVNNEILRDYLSKKTAKAVILSDASFTLSFPSHQPLAPEKREEVINMVREYYYLAKTFPNIYNSTLTTYVYLPKPEK